MLDYEVLKHLNDIRESRDAARVKLKPENVETILLEVHAYLRDRPAGNAAGAQTAEGIAMFIQAMPPYNLEKAEIYQLVNTAPKSLPVLFNCIEECDQRLTDDQMEEILELVSANLGSEPVPEVEEQQPEAEPVVDLTAPE